MPRPTLARGSTGKTVKMLQTALNYEGMTAQPRLAADGIFGPKTEARVKEFQRALALAADGIVGPRTYEQLGPFLVILEALIDYAVKPADEDAARQRISAVAWQWYVSHGWAVTDPGHTLNTVGTTNPRILAKVAAGPTGRTGEHWRQGGQALTTLYRLAGANNPGRCVTIRDKVWEEYGRPGPNQAEGAGPISNNDIGSWCGIFANAVYRLAGLKTQNWHRAGESEGGLKSPRNSSGTNKAGQVMVPDFLARPASYVPKVGDVGVLDGVRRGGLNHHVVVVYVHPDGDGIKTVEGNASHNPHGLGFSEVVFRTRSLRSIRSDRANNYWLTPVWEQILVK